jgi:hypothetical protein
MSAASSAVKIIRKVITNKPRKTILQSRAAIAHSIDNQAAKTRKVPTDEAKALAEKEVGARGRRLVSIESKDKYGKTIKGSPPITDAKPAKKLVVKPSEKLTGRPAGESVVTKTKKIGPKLNLARQKYKDLGGGKVSPERRAEIKRLMDKGVKPDTKVTRSELNDIEPVRPPLSTDEPGKNLRSYKKVIKKIEKPKLETIGDKPKPRKDKPVQGPTTIKRLRPVKVKGKDKSRVVKPSAGTSNMGGPAQGVKRAVVEDNTRTNTPTLLEMAGLSEKQIATFKELAKKDTDAAREYAEKIADAKPPKTNRPIEKIVKKNPTRPSTLAEQQRQRLITKTKEKRMAKKRTKTIKSSNAKQNELARIRRKQKEFEASQKRNN